MKARGINKTIPYAMNKNREQQQIISENNSVTTSTYRKLKKMD